VCVLVAIAYYFDEGGFSDRVTRGEKEKETGVVAHSRVLVLTSQAWKAARRGAYVRNATRPHTRTRVTVGFIKNIRPYFLRRVAAERARFASLRLASLTCQPRVRRLSLPHTRRA